VSSYYDDPDFAEEYRRRDEEGEAAYVEEKEREDLRKVRARDWEQVQRDPAAPEHSPRWTPDPARDREMEEANESWCVLHDGWKTECLGKHRGSA
jgi:hypothetical protein